MIWLTVVVFTALLLVLILAHELGHLVAAKKAGCSVEEFAFGFPPRLFSWVRGGTRFSLNLLPIGGYVKIKGEDMNDPSDSPTNFANKSIPWRILILSAGVLMNVVLAAVLLSIQAGVGRPVAVTDQNRDGVRDIKSFIIRVVPDSPAARAGIEPLDRVVAINGTRDPDIKQIQDVVARQASQSVSLEVERRGVHQTITAVPRRDPPPEEGALGILLRETGLEKTAWWKTPVAGVARTGQMLAAIMEQLWQLLRRLASQGTAGDVLTGPVGIAVYTNEVTSLGLSYVLEFAALISLNLALINILPFPALDGGRVLFTALEGVIGRRMPAKVEHLTHLTGFALLILLMILITFKDIDRFF